MRVLVLFAHPVESSFGAALHQVVVKTLAANGHDIDDCDLYAEGFDPVLSRKERLNYHDLEINRQSVSSHVDRLQKADALVLVTPVWNYGHPAILKGFLDRVFLPGVSFELQNGKIAPKLHTIQKFTTVTTYGGSRLFAFLMGDPPRKIATRVLRSVMGPRAKVRYLAHYDMNRSTDASRRTFLNRVKRHMEQF